MHKYPEYFNVIVQKLEPDGSIKRDTNNNIVLEEEFGELIWWHIVHCEEWKKDLSANTTLSPVPEDHIASGIGRDQWYGYQYKEEEE